MFCSLGHNILCFFLLSFLCFESTGQCSSCEYILTDCRDADNGTADICKDNNRRLKNKIRNLIRTNKKLLLKLYDSGECSAVIDQNISLGNEFWIEVGFIIYMVADGGAAEQIQDSLANALESNPEAVIRYAKKYKEILDLDTICNNDVLNYVSCLSTIDGNILEVAVEKIRKRIKALQGIAFQKTTGKDAGTCIERLRRQLQILERKMKNSGEEKWR